MPGPRHDRKTLHLIDGSGYIFRAYNAIRPLSTRDGTPTQAVLGFLKMLNKLLRQEAPTHVAIAFDTAEDNFRHKIYPDYKANRDEPPEDLVPQFALIHELVEVMGLPPILRPGYEADDVLATLARRALAEGWRVVLVTGDKDLMQLVGPDLVLFDPLKDIYIDEAGVQERFGVAPAQVADILALAGDTSDNIPGVPRVGPKSAAKLVQAFGDVEQILVGLQKQPKRKAFEQAVLDHAASARLSKRLALLCEEVPVDFVPDALRYGGPPSERLAPFLRKIEARGMLRAFGLDEAEPAGGDENVTDAGSGAPATPSGTDAADVADVADVASPADPLLDPAPVADAQAVATHAPAVDAHPLGRYVPAPIDTKAYRTVTDRAELERVVAAARARGVLSFDLETTSLYANEADIVGVSLCVPGEVACYVPIAHHYLGVPKQLPLEDVLATLRGLLSDPKVAKVGQNLKYDALVLRRAGLELAPIGHDSMLLAYVLDASAHSFGLDSLAGSYLNHTTIRYDDVTGTGKKRRPFSDVSVEDATAYAGEDSDVALRLCQLLAPQLVDDGLSAIYRDVELPLLPVLVDMEARGILVDAEHLTRLGHEFGRRLVAIEAEVRGQVGRPISLSSPKQLAELLFEELKYPTGRKTKTGWSTDSEVLENLARTYPLARLALDHRVLSKLKGTYLDALPRMVNPHTGRVHTSFNQTGTATGRLSSSDPNLQNIPARTEDGRRIRAAFVAPPGHKIVSADYSQVELRIMAHLSGDAAFIEAFRRGEDIHRRTAREILAGGQEPTLEMRRRAKAINFGILYGLSEFGLARQLNIPRAEAQAYISAYFGRYPSIRQFLDDVIAEGKRRGYVATLLGRRRPLPNLRSQNGSVRQGAERVAMNTPIQGSAADLIKVAMLRVHRRLRAEGFATRLLLQVHDELVLEAPEGEVEGLSSLLREEMTGAFSLSVPLEVDVGVGSSWAEAH